MKVYMLQQNDGYYIYPYGVFSSVELAKVWVAKYYMVSAKEYVGRELPITLEWTKPDERGVLYLTSTYEGFQIVPKTLDDMEV
jgi:hypothetical protein